MKLQAETSLSRCAATAKQASFLPKRDQTLANTGPAKTNSSRPRKIGRVQYKVLPGPPLHAMNMFREKGQNKMAMVGGRPMGHRQTMAKQWPKGPNSPPAKLPTGPPALPAAFGPIIISMQKMSFFVGPLRRPRRG
jgi:hypothetical protein